MKISLIICLLLIIACQSDRKEFKMDSKKDTLQQKDSTLKTANLPVFPMKKVRIQVYYTSAYCGGAPPNEEILAQAAKKRWYQNSGIKIKCKTADEFSISILTNNEGMAEMELPYGKYAVLLDSNLSEQMSHLFNPECKIVMDKVWKEFTISENGLNGLDSELLWITFDFECDPCDPIIKMRP